VEPVDGELIDMTDEQGQEAEGMPALIARSSLGTPEALLIRSLTPPDTVGQIVAGIERLPEHECHQCGAEVEDSDLVREMEEDPEMVVVCDSCARKVWVAIGLVPEDEE
jgi:uncharacterized protein with PIN domain